MIIKIPYYEQGYGEFYVIDDVKEIHVSGLICVGEKDNVLTNKEFNECLMADRLCVDSDVDFKHFKLLTCEMGDGTKKRISFNTMAYLISANGRVIDTIEAIPKRVWDKSEYEKRVGETAKEKQVFETKHTMPLALYMTIKDITKELVNVKKTKMDYIEELRIHPKTGFILGYILGKADDGTLDMVTKYELLDKTVGALFGTTINYDDSLPIGELRFF